MKRDIPDDLAGCLFQWGGPGGDWGHAMCSCCGSTRNHAHLPKCYNRGSPNYIGITEFKPNSLDELNDETKRSDNFRWLFGDKESLVVRDNDTDYGNALLSWVDEAQVERLMEKYGAKVPV